jgi:hypothetical protein
MTTIKTLISTVVLLSVSTVFAQSSSTCTWFPKGDEDSQGVIGKRYVEAGFDLQNVQHTSHNAYDANISANIPIIKGIDISGGYSYGWYDRKPLHQDYNDIGTSVKLYKAIEDGVKPFISAGLGYSWFNEKLDSGWYFTGNGKNSYSHNSATWGASAGVEFPYKWISVTPRIGYSDDFSTTSKSTQAWRYGVTASSWITSKIGIYGEAAYVAWQHTPAHDWVFGAGVRVRL